ncbi:DUF3857 domain-containing protein [Sediminicola luteus]|uniref:DUF3857 domain-containing protein n=1 Tax=Sediminicola luteus TaxID=319238 RepID=A0A2A4GDF5_9FLAO|nr:DUF3857 domain-containing protein [Sediminicola luteus]PCE66018.1 hypothetical protein B7P33_01570 [Sediminicola luteus]
MKNIRTILPILFFLSILQVSLAQNEQASCLSYDWGAASQYGPITDSEQDMIILKEQKTVEFHYDANGDLNHHFLENTAVWLNADDTIEEYNKIYLPYNSTSQLLVSKARVISPKGKELVLDQSKILEAKDDETGRQYKYFALEGIEKGSIIEYMYIERKKPSYNGIAYRIQDEHPISSFSFKLESPKSLEFKLTSSNGIPEAVKDTVNGKNIWKIGPVPIAELEREEGAAYDALRGSVSFKLDRNYSNGMRNISGYSQVSQNIFNYYYPNRSLKELEPLMAFIEEVSGTTSDLESQIRKLEDYIKTNVFLTEGNDPGLEDLKQVIEQKIANNTGVLKLYTALFEQLGITHELVLTCNRLEDKFDPVFQSHHFLRDYLIYFPKQDKYLDPHSLYSRYGYPTAQLTDNYGLFIKKVFVGSFKAGLDEVRYINPVPSSASGDNLDISISMAADAPENTQIEIKREISGYYASYMHPYMDLMKEEDEEELMDSFAKSYNQGLEAQTYSFTNKDPKLFGQKPLGINMSFDTNLFVEKAGNRYLLNIGQLIGEQMQMYQEKKRVLPYENDHQRYYDRTIKVRIPDGYSILNPEDAVIEHTHKVNGSKVFEFVSGYEMNTNEMQITIKETYAQNIVAPEDFEGFRKVINAAADFNKVVLVVAPK